MKRNWFGRKKLKQNSSGFILVVSLLILLVLTFIGIAINRYTTTELKITANDKLHLQSFYQADGGSEFGAEALEQNIACILFSNNGDGVEWLDTAANGDMVLDGNIAVEKGAEMLWLNSIGKWTGTGMDFPTDDNRDMWFPPVYGAGEPHTNITVEGIVDLIPGASIIQAAGYVGLGRSSAVAGVAMDYEIHSRHLGLGESESQIRIEWRHIVGREENYCRYD
ncbi:PilX N-terminal domain-containing pilus assembly protein [Desulfosediminicola flagellatus]|uniref:PilX N-terminal domain-containing pilus assembly protein n=1 Tax=Desulfosediminicola flagellatus TaxID=2569541 RepID=UPI0010AD2B1E|nr:PilX N-terminal domain-containing pilus assembly protein [Desulfosediminicola flagellatus]